MIVNEINIKIAVLGSGGVGKTSLISAYLEKSFPLRYVPTIGSTIAKKEYKLKDHILRLAIWDIGGQLRFNVLNPVLFNNVDFALLIFDLTKPKDTLSELKNIYLENLRKNSDECVVLAIGNKLDLIPNENDVKELLNQYDLKEVPLILASAKINSNVIEGFELGIFMFLESWAKKFPNESFNQIALEFLKLCGTTENELKSRCVELENLNSFTLKKHVPSPMSQKVISKEEGPSKKAADGEKIVQLQHRLKKIDLIKNEIIENFNKNLKVVTELVSNLKQTPISSLVEAIDNTTEQLTQIKTDFELNLESMLNLEKDESRKAETKSPQKLNEKEILRGE